MTDHPPDDAPDRRPEAPEAGATDSPTRPMPESEETLLATTPGSGALAGAAPELQPGDRLGAYEIVGILGGGGMGQVYEALHGESGHRLAIKVLPGRALQTKEARERFLREGTLAAAINHPNSLYVYGTEEIDGTPLIAMELAAGGTLKDRVEAEGALAPAAAASAALQIVSGLRAAAERGVLHRDVKPANCFVDRDGTVKVGDYGLSISTMSEEATQLTATGAFLGTPAYASPEQIRGESVDERADIYSVGATLYYLLTGDRIFADTSGLQLMAAILQKDVPRLRPIRPEIPKRLEEVVLRCLAKDRDARFPDHAALERALAPLADLGGRAAGFRERLGAGLVDFVILNVPIFVIGARIGMQADWTQEVIDLPPLKLWFDTVLRVVLVVLYGMILEGRWGVSVGKLLFGLRVSGPEGGPPGLAAGALRAAIFVLPATAMAIASNVSMLQGHFEAAVALGLLSSFSYPLLFVGARRGNGWAAIHDRASRSGVVAGRREARRTGSRAETETPPPPGDRRIGPFDVPSDAELAPGALIEGYDSRLRRRVWIEGKAPDAPSVPAARRVLGRSARLRWLHGRRGPDESWDAWERVPGEPLLEASRAGRSWSVVRYWLRDLAEEIEVGRADDTLDFDPDETHVWITADGHALLTEFRAPGSVDAAASRPDEIGPSRPRDDAERIARIGDRALRGDGRDSGTEPAPVFARALLDRLRAGDAGTIAEVRGAILAASEQPESVSRSRRLAQFGVLAALPLLFLALFGLADFSMGLMQKEIPGIRTLDSTVSRLMRYEKADSLTVEQSTRRDALTVFLAGPLRDSVPDSASYVYGRRVDFLKAEDREWLADFFERHPVPDPEEVEAMQPAIDEFVTEVSSPLFPWGTPTQASVRLPVVLTALAAHLVAPFGLLWAILLGGGAAARMTGTEIVRGDGMRAGRLRTLARAAIAWAPALLTWYAALVVNGVRAPLDPRILRETSQLLRKGDLPILAIVGAVLFFGGVVWAVARPARGLQDRLAGTWLVPK